MKDFITEDFDLIFDTDTIIQKYDFVPFNLNISDVSIMYYSILIDIPKIRSLILLTKLLFLMIICMQS